MASSVSSSIVGRFNGESTLRSRSARSEFGNRATGGASSIAHSVTRCGGHGHAKRHSIMFEEVGMKKEIRGILEVWVPLGMLKTKGESGDLVRLGQLLKFILLTQADINIES